MSALKDIYSPVFYNKLSNCLEQVIVPFNRIDFIQHVFTASFKQMELKARMRHTAQVLHNFLPANFGKATKLIESLITVLRKEHIGEDSLGYMFLPDYIETYGLNDYAHSIKALEYITQFTSCEFAVRPFILKYGDTMIAQMQQWSLHESYKVRRFASEGSRPRLPWAMAIPALKKDPSPILPLLENLKNDPSEYVRRSVANSLNDIARDNPDIVIKIAKKWQGHSKETDAIIKHGSRTLLKQGHQEILKYYGLQSENIMLADFKIITPTITVGDSLGFTFLITNKSKKVEKIRLEYAIFYRMKNGKPSKKVFKISERNYQPDETAIINRKQKFILITTRKFYVGQHKIAIIVNGEEKAMDTFELMDK